jgi:hypothetical protein
MRITPEVLEDEVSLSTAATRLDFLSRRDDGGTTPTTVEDADPDGWASIRNMGTSLDVHEALELLALGELIARRARGSRLTGIRAALREGAGWNEIAAALGVTPGQAWDDFTRALDDGALTAEAAASARQLAGARPT